jgi:hypothetical protein
VQRVKTDGTLESVAVGTAANVWAVGDDRTDPMQDQAPRHALERNKVAGREAARRAVREQRLAPGHRTHDHSTAVTWAATGILTGIATTKDRTWAVGMTATSTTALVAHAP